MTKRTAIACVAAVASTLWACEEPLEEIDAGMDAGPIPFDSGPPRDAGPDTGPPEVDAGPPDAGPPPYFTGRLVNNIPGMPAVEVCVWTQAGSTIIGSGTHVTAGALNVPFRGVSSYLGTLFQALPGIDYLLALYDEATFNVRTGCGGGGEPACTCPADPTDSGAPTAALIGTATSDQFMAGRTYTIVASGLAEGTLGAAAGELPSRCGATYSSLCTAATATRLIVVEDDLTPPAAGMVKIRVSNQVPNVSPAHFLPCYDADIFPDMATPGNCLEPADLTAPQALSSSVAYATVTPYAERDPLLPSMPTLGAGGGIYLAPVAPGTMTCPTFTENAAVVMHTRCYPILGLESPPNDPPFPPTIRAHVASGDIITLFVSGALSAAPDPNFGPSFFLWQDNYVAPTP